MAAQDVDNVDNVDNVFLGCPTCPQFMHRLWITGQVMHRFWSYRRLKFVDNQHLHCGQLWLRGWPAKRKKRLKTRLNAWAFVDNVDNVDALFKLVADEVSSLPYSPSRY